MVNNKNLLSLLVLHIIPTVYCIIDPYSSAKEPILISLINDSTVLRFGKTSTKDYYRLLDFDADRLLIGARDVVYNISIESFGEVQSIKWPSEERDVKECLTKGRSKDECHNYIRVLARDGLSNVLICGTNSFEPKCRQYEHEKDGEYGKNFEFQGQGLSPYDPNHNSTFLRDGDMLYAGTVSDFSGSDPLIHRRNVTKDVDLGIRTSRNDAKFLNEPQFAGSFKDDKYVYMWFREQAGESECSGRAVYSRVARLCRSDVGGPKSYSAEWTSFVKARLNCSIPGDYPFYFDQIEAIAKPVSGVYSVRKESAKLVYAVFGSPLAGISSSAICAFDLSHITMIFSNSSYHHNGVNRHSTWLREESIFKYRPGTCVADSRKLPEETVAYARANLLMDDAVKNYFGSPLAVHSGADHFTHISIDAQVQALDGRFYDLLYVGTDKGNIFKLVNLAGAGAKTNGPSHHIYTIHVTEEPIRNMMLFKSEKLKYIDYSDNESYLIVVSDRTVIRVPPVQCSKFRSCDECISLRDPHCAWDTNTNRCVKINEKSTNLKQDIIEGRANHICETGEKVPRQPNDAADSQEGVVPSLPNVFNNCSCGKTEVIDRCPLDVSGPIPSVVTSESASSTFDDRRNTVLLSVGLCILAATIGFLTGRFCSHLKVPQKDNSSLLPASFRSPLQPVYSENVQRRSSNQSPANVINAYASTPKFNGSIPSFISPIPLDVSEIEKSQSKLAWETSTLPRNYRVKQMYL